MEHSAVRYREKIHCIECGREMWVYGVEQPDGTILARTIHEHPVPRNWQPKTYGGGSHAGR